ncbi:MAG TPA: hypothetical protein VK928_05870, partial [Longimicrobiales bacterium]|nr:hypothetical protein [Longimicrobiales bacterium]
TCGLGSGGGASCWGHNDEGQLGDGTFTTRDRPVAVSGGIVFTAVSAGHAHSCGLTADGSAYCWGDDSRGQLGDGAGGATRSTRPVRVLGERAFARVVAGYYASCALGTDGAAWCWGRNDEGQLGDGTTEQRDEPVRVSGSVPFTALDVGDRFACALRSGQAWCWGENRHDVLGTGAAGMSAVPVRVDGTTSLTTITTSIGPSTIGGAEAYACGTRTDGSALCWGGATRGLRARSATPVHVGEGIRFTALAAGTLHACGLNRDGYAFCGGGNGSGQLGDGTRTDRATMVGVAGSAR